MVRVKSDNSIGWLRLQVTKYSYRKCHPIILCDSKLTTRTQCNEMTPKIRLFIIYLPIENTVYNYPKNDNYRKYENNRNTVKTENSVPIPVCNTYLIQILIYYRYTGNTVSQVSTGCWYYSSR